MKRRQLPSIEEICKNSRRVAILENIVNPTNIGAIFRSAAALHMDAVLLTGGCSNPLYRRAARVSMGTVFQIPWTYFEKKTSWPEEGMKKIQNLGFKTVAMALRDDSYSIDDPELLAEEKLAVILGTEGDGLASQTIADCDYTVKIPMLMVWILLMWQLQVLWHSGNWVGNDSENGMNSNKFIDDTKAKQIMTIKVQL